MSLVPVAHGIGGQRDLPISLNLAVAGAVAALVISFAVLALAWRTPRYDSTTSGRPVPPGFERVVRSRWFRVALRVLGLWLFLFTAFTSIFGVDTIINPFFGLIFVVLWVGLVPASLLFGPFWKAISPVRTINAALTRIAGSDPATGIYAYPVRLGLWPAAVGLYAFVWLELVYPFNTEVAPVRLWCAVYVTAMLVGGVLFGDRFYESCDPFEVYSSFVAKLSIWSERDGRLVVRSPLANLSSVQRSPGLLAVMAVLFGSTGFDSFKDSSRWITFVQSSSIDGHLLSNLGLIAFVLLAGAVFSLATMLTGIHPVAEAGGSWRERVAAQVRARLFLPAAFAHSIIPIVLGYIVAHYLSFAFDIGSRTIVLSSDPLSNGSNIFGTADLPDFTWWSYHPTLLAVTKVLTVVLGHIVAAVAAHDRALHLLPRRHQLTGQLPLLIAMVAFTTTGLYLLFAA